MNIDKPENPFTAPLATGYSKQPPKCEISSYDRSSGSFAATQLQKLLDDNTQYLMAVPHNGPRITDTERTLLERDLAATVASLDDPHDLLSVIKLLSAIEHVLTTLVMDTPTQYSMSQLWGIASRYMGPNLYKRNIDIRRHQAHWVAMRRTATKEIIGKGYLVSFNLFESISPEDFDSLQDYLVTLAWATATDEESGWCIGIYHIMSKLGPILGNGGLLEKVGDALSSVDPASELDRYRLDVEALWRRGSGSQQKSKKRKK
ncbi:YALIA101S07e04544g1_1 [Yarrowia lipolytica]|jgi:hypothetical protein|nr:Hypothetical protein YALI2_D01088g [Yarrowia lipolytica]SEI35576.1 YALIA101S07e04544g1_1 [Yarrowia lipolytica]